MVVWGTGRRPCSVDGGTRQRGYADQFPALLFAFGSRGLEHTRSYGLERFRHGGLPLYIDVARALDHLFHFVEVAARFLDGDDVGMAREFDHHFGGDVVPGGLREVVDDDRQRGPVSDRAIESEQVRGQHLPLVVVRSAHHGGVIAEFGGILGEPQSFMCGLDARARDHDFARRSGGESGLQHVAAFLIRKQNRLAG